MSFNVNRKKLQFNLNFTLNEKRQKLRYRYRPKSKFFEAQKMKIQNNVIFYS